MNTRQRCQRGFSLVEMMISLTVMLIIIVAIFSIIVAEQSTHLTEGRKLDMNQGGRVIEQMFSEGFRSSGSVLSQAQTPVMLGLPTIPFNGVYPLNNNDYPDGVILASGDPLALTRLTQIFTPGDATVNVTKVDLPPDPVTLTVLGVAWHEGDFGLIMRPDGYTVFKVSLEPDLGDTLLTIRQTAAYYSGLLDTAHYNDQCDEQLGTKGNIGAYPIDSPVLRLEYFNIFLTRTESDGSRTLTLTTDCEGLADIFASTSPITGTRAAPILPNIEDIQIEYLTKVVPPAILPDIWAGTDNAFPGGTVDFYNQFYNRNIASARIFVLLRTEEEKNKSLGSGIVFKKPAMGDMGAATLPVGRYHYTYMQYEILIRNYNY
ncbi:MAG: prepilin-type N-terminal cleavage/methylation domain-containing protein [Candidatus Aminicenantes bacterium]|nr:prepilin-type N-terminal cleavage/methylation domain-containing protein [Candidatus Aminicenantes bacterium]